MLKGILVTAHTGCEGTAPNSLEAIKKGAECGAEIVEIDVRYNGKFCILSHEKKYDKPVTLRDALAEVATYDALMVNLDLKEFDHVKEVIAEVEAAGLRDRVLITGVSFKHFRRVKSVAGDIPVFVNCFPVLGSRFKYFADRVARKLKNIGAAGINTNKKFATKVLADATKDAGLQFSVWTVSKKSEIGKVSRIKPNNITTRIPSALKDK